MTEGAPARSHRRRGVLALALLGAAIAACAAAIALRFTTTARDAALVAAVRRAAAQGVPLDEVAVAVGAPPTMSGPYPYGGGTISAVEMDIPPPVVEVILVTGWAYWVRPVDDEHGNPRVIGIQWRIEPLDGDYSGHVPPVARVFTGVVPPP